MLGISKRGDVYLRNLLIHGARAVLRTVERKEDRTSRWAMALKAAPLRQHDSTAYRMRFASALRWLQGPSAPSPLRPDARAYACRALPASCFALPWRAAIDWPFRTTGGVFLNQPDRHVV